jgi:hypothetical protein
MSCGSHDFFIISDMLLPSDVLFHAQVKISVTTMFPRPLKYLKFSMTQNFWLFGPEFPAQILLSLSESGG